MKQTNVPVLVYAVIAIGLISATAVSIGIASEHMSGYKKCMKYYESLPQQEATWVCTKMLETP